VRAVPEARKGVRVLSASPCSAHAGQDPDEVLPTEKLKATSVHAHTHTRARAHAHKHANKHTCTGAKTHCDYTPD
jgi:hypothetical protein